MLNLLFRDKTNYVDRVKYNYVPYCYMTSDRGHFYNSQEELKANCRIIHMFGGSKPWENINKMAADKLWWEYAVRTPFYLDMKIKHVQAMLHKEQKINSVIEGHINAISRSKDAECVITEVEETLYQILEREFKIMDVLEKNL